MTTTTHQDLAARLRTFAYDVQAATISDAMADMISEALNEAAAALEAASQPPGAEPECARWNFDATDTAIVVCKNLHDKGEKCEYEEMHPASVLQIINDLRSRVLEHTARAALSAPSPAQAPVVQGEAQKRGPLSEDEFFSLIDSAGIRADPSLAGDIKLIVEQAHGIFGKEAA